MRKVFVEQNNHGADHHEIRTHGPLLICNTVSYDADGVQVAEHITTECRDDECKST
jgi:hypothetical protein